MIQPPENLSTLEALKEIVSALRGPNGCPWDKKQTPQTLTRYVIEEAFELAEAIDQDDRSAIIDELGDYLFQVALQVQIAQETKQFNWQNVLQNLNTKMVRRHPHVFGSETAQTPEEVLKRWHELKQQEKANKPASHNPLNVSSGLPALMRAQKLGEKSTQVSFDWSQPEEVWVKVQEELEELRSVLRGDREKTKLREEIGDVFFTLVQLARHLGVDAEAALRSSNTKFESRFRQMLALGGLTAEQFKALAPDQKEDLWAKAKQSLAFE